MTRVIRTDRLAASCCEKSISETQSYSSRGQFQAERASPAHEDPGQAVAISGDVGNRVIGERNLAAVRPVFVHRCSPYRRRRPAETVLYQLVQEHLETFLALSDDGAGVGLPGYVERDFRKYLDCGVWPEVLPVRAAKTAVTTT